MRNIKKLVDKFIVQIDGNIYQIKNFDEEKENLRKSIIKEKYILAQKKINFTLDDFVLVRITDENNVPRNFTYYELDERNVLFPIESPFYPILGYLKYDVEEYASMDVGISHEKIEYKKFSILSPRNRVTKHFAINGLASNINRIFIGDIKFDVGDFIIIEPLRSRIQDKRLYVLNPVDTFFNLKDAPMTIGDDAIFMIKEKSLSKYLNDPKMSERLKRHKIYVFENDPATAVDIVLINMGIMPQRTYNQSEIKSDYFFEDKVKISDEDFIKQYQAYFEYLNNLYLYTSYFNIPEKYINYRKENASYLVNVPGILHIDTELNKIDKRKNFEGDIVTYSEYLRYMFDVADIHNCPINDMVSLIAINVFRMKDIFERNFTEIYDEYEKELFEVVQKLSYPIFQQETDRFNDIKKKRLDPERQG